MINDGNHIVSIINRVSCQRHFADLGIPCFHLPRSKGDGYYAAICNKRAVLAGAGGQISKASYQAKQQRKPGKKRFS